MRLHYLLVLLLGLSAPSASPGESQERKREILAAVWGDTRIRIDAGEGWVSLYLWQGVDHVQLAAMQPEDVREFTARARAMLAKPVGVAPGEEVEDYEEIRWGETIALHRTVSPRGDRLRLQGSDRYVIHFISTPLTRQRAEMLLTRLESAASAADEMKANR